MIKFRGIPLEDVSYIDGVNFDGTFVYGNYVKYSYGALIVGDVLEASEGPSWWVQVDPKTVEQFIGLTDVNGKDVYEGDIIQYSDHFYEYSMGGVTNLEAEYIGVVVKNNFDLGILINRISNTDAHINHYNAKEFVPFCEFEDPEADVLLKGNVHANPELLEEDE